jgi:hypothetical protein
MEGGVAVFGLLLLAGTVCLSVWYWKRYVGSRTSEEREQDEFERRFGVW